MGNLIQHVFPSGKSSARTLLTMLCIALLLICGAVQVSHGHLLHDSHYGSDADCAICVTAHVGVTLVSVPVQVHTVTVVGHVESEPQGRMVAGIHFFDLYVRPPPTVLTLA